MTTPTVAAKRALRRQLLAARVTMTAGALATAAGALAAHVAALSRRAGVVAAYVPIGSEPGGGDLLGAIRGQLLLPIAGADGELEWAAYDGDLARNGRLGLLEPTGERLGRDALQRADLVLAPALAADRAGRRIGRGAGYYDRALERLPDQTPIVALLHDTELIAEVPAEPHDRMITGVITPTGGYLAVGPGGS